MFIITEGGLSSCGSTSCSLRESDCRNTFNDPKIKMDDDNVVKV
jgi:hypothetical protein